MTEDLLRQDLRVAIESLNCLRGRGFHDASSVGLDLSERLAPTIEYLLAGIHRGDSELVRRSERNPLLTKYCLWYDSEIDVEVRLNHYHRAAYSVDSAHDHKWKFVSLILSGAVDHFLYSASSDDPLDGFAVRHRRGDSYFLGEHLPHCFVPLPQTVTLMVRGPRSKESWFRRELAGDSAGTVRTDDALKAERAVLTEADYHSFFARHLPQVLARSGWRTT